MDYEETAAVVRMLTDVRFKLLTLVPTVTALGVVIAKDRSLGDALGIAIVGLAATIGILVYELRNSQLYGAAMHRARQLEQRMRLRRSNVDPEPCESAQDSSWPLGGVFDERPPTLRLAGVVIKHDHGLALVYGAAIAGWSYVFLSAFLPFLWGESLQASREHASASPTWLPLAIAVVIGALTWFLIGVFERRGDDRRGPVPPGTWRTRDDHQPDRAVALLIRSGDARRISTKEALIDANRPARAKSR